MTSSDVPIVLSRWLHFLSLAVAFGASLFWFYGAPAESQARSSFERASDRIVRCCACLTLLSGLGWLASSIVLMTGDPSLLLDRETLSDFFFETSFGPVWIVRLLLLVALAGLAAGIPRGRTAVAKRGVIAILAGTAFASQAWLGHAAMARGNVLGIELASYVGHVLAAGAWIGGLVPLSLLAIHQGPAEDAASINAYAGALRRFSHLGMALVLVILVTGVANSVFRLGSADDLVTTVYGLTILVKVLLFAMMLTTAAFNRWQLMPRIDRQRIRAIAAIRRNVLVEGALGMLVLAAAAVLGTLPP